jgi:putative transcriptional regulator
MRDEDFAQLVSSIREAGAIKRGEKEASRRFTVTPPDIKEVREKLGVSQNQFALMIGVSPRTLQNWEQGRRRPDGPANALLRIAARDPQAVLAALHED